MSTRGLEAALRGAISMAWLIVLPGAEAQPAFRVEGGVLPADVSPATPRPVELRIECPKGKPQVVIETGIAWKADRVGPEIMSQFDGEVPYEQRYWFTTTDGVYSLDRPKEWLQRAAAGSWFAIRWPSFPRDHEILVDLAGLDAALQPLRAGCRDLPAPTARGARFPRPSPSAPPLPGPGQAGGWVFEAAPSLVTGQALVAAILQSPDSIVAGGTSQQLSLAMRCRLGEFEAYVVGDRLVDPSPANDTTVFLSMDGTPAKGYPASVGFGGHSLFLTEKAIRALRTARQLGFKLHQNADEASFPLAGLDRALATLEQVCKLPKP